GCEPLVGADHLGIGASQRQPSDANGSPTRQRLCASRAASQRINSRTRTSMALRFLGVGVYAGVCDVSVDRVTDDLLSLFDDQDRDDGDRRLAGSNLCEWEPVACVVN